jgi:competence protein ComEC
MLLLVALVLGAVVGQVRARTYDSAPPALSQARSFDATGYLLERFRRSGDGLRGRLVANSGALRGARIELRVSAESDSSFRPVALGPDESSEAALAGLPIGAELAVKGSMREVTRLVDASRDDGYARWLRAEGVDALVRVEHAAPTGRARGGLQGALDAVRVRSEAALAAGLPAQTAALMRGMVLGGDEQFSAQLRDEFRVVGLSHIVAVSGANVMLLAILIGAVCGAFGIGHRSRFLIAVGCILIYVPLCGAGASVIRAGVMGVAALCATQMAREVSRVHLLLLAALALLALNPRALEDIGAQLSFIAVVGLIGFAGRWQRWLTGRLRIPRWLAEALAATAAATLATLPVSAFHFGRVSLVSLAANVLAAPVIGPIVWIGSLEAMLGQLAVWPAQLLNALAGFMLGYLIELAHTMAGVPWAQVRLEFGWVALCGSLLAIAVVVAYLHSGATSMAPGRLRDRLIHVFTHTRLGPRPAMLITVALITVGAFAPVALRQRHGGSERPAIVFLDVGQGDAVLLLGSSGCEALIDGGPRGGGLSKALRRFRAQRPELVVATHPAADHHGGLLEAARDGGLQTSRFLAGGLPSGDRSYAQLEQVFASHGAALGEAASGVRWSCGDLRLEVIGPRPARAGDRPPDDPNTRAAVIRATVGATTLLSSGDAESPQLLPLVLDQAEVFKVPHHGSEDSGLVRVLERVRPRVAVIQVGERNSYGHPRSATLAALSGVSSVWRTDRDGTVVVRATPSPARERREGSGPVARTR